MKTLIALTMLIAFYCYDKKHRLYCFTTDEITAQAKDWKQDDIKRAQNNSYRATTYSANWGE